MFMISGSCVLGVGGVPGGRCTAGSGGTFVVGAIGPDGGSDPGGFAAACSAAGQRLSKVEDD